MMLVLRKRLLPISFINKAFINSFTIKPSFMASDIKTVTRKEFIGITSLVAAGALIFPKSLLRQDSPVHLIINEAKKSPVTIEKITDKISLLQGSGGNIGVLNTAEGKLMIEAGIDVSRAKIKEALAKISDKPLRHLINTHWHFDHTSGNEWLQQEGATITAHINTKQNLSRQIRVKEWNYTFPPAAKNALPVQTFEKEHQLNFGGTSIRLHHFGPAHTDSDIFVFFEKENVLFTGDVWWNGYYPFIDADTKGNINGMITAVKTCLAKVNDNTIIIPGHGPKGNKQQLEKFRDMLTTISDRVKSSKKSGKSLEQVVAAKPTKEFDAIFGNFVINGDWFTRLVYDTI